MPNLIQLNNLKLPIVSPTIDYSWPIRPGWRPRDHQMAMADFQLLHPRCFNLSDMGTQKTLASLWAADRAMEAIPGTKCLIVAPLSTLEVVWGDAIFTDLMGKRTFAVLHGTHERRMKQLDRDVDFYIVNHDGMVGANLDGRRLRLRGFAEALHVRDDIQIVIYDEATALKDALSNRSKVARFMLAGKQYVWCLTATPTANRPTDAYGMGKFLCNAHGETFTSFRERTMIHLTQFKWAVRSNAANVVAQFLQPAIRYNIEDCYDLPPCTTQQRAVDFSAEQRDAFNALKRQLSTALKSGARITAINEASLRIKLFQICCGAIYDGEHEAHPLDVGPRLKELDNLLDNSLQKVIIFAQFSSVVDLIFCHLRESGVPVAKVTGATGTAARKEIFNSFQSKEAKYRAIVADPRTMSHGLTLTEAKMIVWFGPIDDNEVYDQANHRIDRPGQEHPTTIVQLASCAVEHEAYKRLDERGSMQGLVLKLIEERF